MKLRPRDLPLILYLYNNGWSTLHIANHYGVTQRRIQQIIKSKKLLVPGRKSSRVSVALMTKIMALKRKGMDLEQVYAELHHAGILISKDKLKELFFDEGEIMADDIYNSLRMGRSLLYLDILNLKTADGIFKGIILINLTSCRVVDLSICTRASLRNVISVLSKALEDNPDVFKVCIHKIPPLMPTRWDGNRLIDFLHDTNTSFCWVTTASCAVVRNMSVGKLQRKIRNMAIDDAKEWILDEGITSLEKTCEELMSVYWTNQKEITAR